MSKKYLLIFALLLVLAAPAMAANITHFNGAAASTEDKTDYLVLGKGLSGNVTVLFDNNGNSFTLDATNATLVIKYVVNISSYSYSASGDTTNLTVTRNPLNLTFTYSGTSTVTISNVSLTFNYSSGLSTSTGIDTGTALYSKRTLAYVSEYINSYNASTTPEKISYIVFDPDEVYHYIATISSTDGNMTTTITDASKKVLMNFSSATTNKVKFDYTVYRYNYSATLVPVHRVYYAVFINKTYFTNVVPIPGANSTDIGLKESDGYIEVLFIDAKPDYNSTFMVVAYAWDGNISKGYKFEYTIDPVGGLQTTSEHTKDVNITSIAALVAPPTALYWWQYEIYGINILLWIGIIATILIVALVVYRASKGLPVLGKGFVASAFVTYALLSFIAQLTEWTNTAWTWLQENYVFVGIIALVAIIVVLVSVIHFGTRE